MTTSARRSGLARLAAPALASVALLTRLAAASPQPPSMAFEPGLEVPLDLVIEIQFWIDVFARYSQRQVVVQNRQEPAAVLGVESVRTGEQAELARVRKQFATRLTQMESVARESDTVADDGPRAVDPHWIGIGVDRLRLQRGQREVFADSLLRSRAHLSSIRRALRAAKLPLALAYLPHVESSFNPEATSPAGAAGIWQLMPDTARENQLRVDEEIDERRDAEKSTLVALAYLREAHRRLGSWPLAITAYNYGVSATARGVQELGTRDFGVFRAGHSGVRFGFAGRNYYAQFLAAAHVAQHHRFYFPELRLPPLVEYVVCRGDTLSVIAQRHGVPMNELRTVNKLDRAGRIRAGQRLIIES